VEPECHRRRCPCPEAPRLKAAATGACCSLPPRIRDGGGDPQVAAARVGLGDWVKGRRRVLWRVGAEGREASTWRRTIDPKVGSIRRRREVRRSGDAATGRRHRDGWAVRHQFLGWTSGSGVRDVGGSGPRGCGGRWLGWTHREDAGAGRTRGRGRLTDGGQTHGGMTHQLFVLLPFFILFRSRELHLGSYWPMLDGSPRPQPAG
jgi:hypothetical protein